MKVPFLDLKIQYDSIKHEIDSAVQQVMERTAFAGGPFVEEFEKNFASFCGCRYAIGVGSGTDALWLALLSFGVGPGDEVITVPNTFIATVEAISLCGAKPVFVDIDEHSFNMNPELLEAAVTDKTKAIIPVHLFGQMADMDKIMNAAKKHGLFVIEDACQAHGAQYKGRMAGSIAHAGCFSFYPGKNLGAYGEAGAIVTNDEKPDKNSKVFRDHGQNKKYHHEMIGWNCRMDGLQGAVLNAKLKHLPEWIEARRKNASFYNELLVSIHGLSIPRESDYAKHVYHIYPILVSNRDALLKYLAEKEIFCGIHYPIPIHLTEAYKFLGYGKGSFPVAENIADQLLSLPMYPELSREQIEHVADGIKEFMNK